jgi:heme/copper-type cytochrome/quinol oxidase subunit 2
MMTNFSIEHRDGTAPSVAARRQFGAALAQLALTVALIVSIVVVLTVASASGAMAQRSDLMVMEESTALTTTLIVGIIVVVMGILTMLAIRDASPTKRSDSRRPTATRR